MVFTTPSLVTCAQKYEAGKSSSSDDEDQGDNKADDGAESAGVTTDALMTDAAATPEPGTTPEPEPVDEKTDALAALLAAGEMCVVVGHDTIGLYTHKVRQAWLRTSNQGSAPVLSYKFSVVLILSVL